MPPPSSTDSDTASMLSLASTTSSTTTLSSSTHDDKYRSSGSTVSVQTTRNTQVVLPRILGKPQMKHVSREAIASVDPDLAAVPLAYIIRSLKALGPRMMSTLARTTASPPHALPRELVVSIAPDANAASSELDILPTHLLAIYSRSEKSTPAPGKAPRRKVTLFPTHAIVLAAHCAHLPLLPSGRKKLEVDPIIKSDHVAPADSVPATDDVDTTEDTAERIAGPSTPLDMLHPVSTEPIHVTLPIIPLCIPAPATFPILQAYFYTKRVDQLLASLIPNPSIKDHSQTEPFPAITSGEDLVRQLAMLSIEVLVRAALRTHALWANVSALGVFDEPLWQTIALAWHILLSALELAQECDSDDDDDAFSVDFLTPPENDTQAASRVEDAVDMPEITVPVDTADENLRSEREGVSCGETSQAGIMQQTSVS